MAIYGCIFKGHNYEIIKQEQFERYNTDDAGNDKLVNAYIVYILKCKRCGKIKKKTIFLN